MSLLTLQTLSSPWLGLVYIAVFGIGFIAGMALISIVISIPLRAPLHMAVIFNGLQTTIGVATNALFAFL